jgi:putative PIN family toxin of toxin-antitoxin system
VIISALLSPAGPPALLLSAWRSGRFELIVSNLLLAEVERALSYPKLRRRISEDDARTAVRWLRLEATVRPDPSGPPAVHSDDPDDDYLIALAAVERAVLVPGDEHLLRLGSNAIASPATFLARLAE